MTNVLMANEIMINITEPDNLPETDVLRRRDNVTSWLNVKKTGVKSVCIGQSNSCWLLNLGFGMTV